MLTLDSTDATLRHGLDMVFPRANHLDYEAAHQLADWLQERDDWRWHLLRAVAFVQRFDNAYALTRRGQFVGQTPRHPAPAVIAAGACQCRVGWHDRGVPGPDGVAICTVHPVLDGTVNTSIWSWLTPAEYDALRADAAIAGVEFPARP